MRIVSDNTSLVLVNPETENDVCGYLNDVRERISSRGLPMSAFGYSIVCYRDEQQTDGKENQKSPTLGQRNPVPDPFITMRFIGQGYAFPSNPSNGDMFYLKNRNSASSALCDNVLYVFSNGIWERLNDDPYHESEQKGISSEECIVELGNKSLSNHRICAIKYYDSGYMDIFLSHAANFQTNIGSSVLDAISAIESASMDILAESGMKFSEGETMGN